MRIRLITIPPLMVVGLLISSGGPALAKGPESATITGPGIEQPIQLLDEKLMDATYGASLNRFMRQTGLWYATGDLPVRLAAPSGELGPRHTLTWINSGPPGDSVSDRTIVQFLYLDAENGPVIHTPAALEGWGPGTVGWFAAPDDLPDTLAELGVPVLGSAPQSNPAFWLMVAIGVIVAGSLGTAYWSRSSA